MNNLPNLEQFRDVLHVSKNILIAVGNNVNYETLAASLAFYLSLSKTGKTVTIVSPKEPTVEEANLVGIDKIAHSLGKSKFIIAIKDALGSVEKVTHYLEGDKLNIVIHPLTEASLIGQDQIEFLYNRPNYDLIVLFEVPELVLLENLYTQEQNIYSEAKIAYVGKTYPIDNISQVAIIEPSLSVSEITSFLLAKLEMPIDKDIGRNLFYGMRSATNGFQSPPATVITFELAAFCLKGEGYPKFNIEGVRVPSPNPPSTVGVVEPPKEDLEQEEESESVKPEPDWFTPKIYKSSKNIS